MPQLRRRAPTPAARHPSQPQPSSHPRSLVSVFKPIFLALCIPVGYLLYIYCPLDPTSSLPSSPTFNDDLSELVLPSQPEALGAIKTAIKNSWLAYANSPAWGSDDFYVLSQAGGNLTEAGSIGFIVDVLDTIMLTGEMDEEYQRCRRYVQDELRFDVDGKFNAFETTIRVLGGLLSAYHLSGNDTVFLEKAIDLGTRLLPIFDSVVYKEMYDKAMMGVKEELLQQTPNGLMYIGELHPRQSSYAFSPKQDHLVCFLGGTLLLGVTEGIRSLNHSDVSSLSDQDQQDWFLGQELINTCVNTYQASETGLGPEIAHFNQQSKDVDRANQREWYIPHYNRQSPPLDARNILRPETVESLFFAWRATKDPIYRKWGWQIFQAFNEHCKVESTGAFASINDVDRVPTELQDRMETFWLAETLKYLLLLFSDDSVVPLNSHVLNTEAHIFPVFTPSFESDM